MGMKTSSTLLAGMICAVLGGCSTDRTSAMNDNTYGPGYGAYSSTSSPGSGSSGSSMGGSNASPTGTAAGGSDMSRSAAMNPGGVVLTIEAIPRAQATGPISGQYGSSGTSGTSGASSGSSASDVVYRITLRQEDGTTRSVNQEAQPSVQIGDRVRMENGMLERY